MKKLIGLLLVGINIITLIYVVIGAFIKISTGHDIFHWDDYTNNSFIAVVSISSLNLILNIINSDIVI